MYTRWFNELTKTDVASAGGKAANLGELTHAGLPVPRGFVVTVAGFERFLSAAQIEKEIAQRMRDVNVNDPVTLDAAAVALQQLITNAAVPDDVIGAIDDAYRQLRADGSRDVRVAVRSSATVEDTAQYSFAGMFRTTLNVTGSQAVVAAVKDCWGSLFSARLLCYLGQQQIETPMRIAVVVQTMVDSEKSGVLFTVDPAAADTSRIVIEAVWGLGETIVSGQVTPDRHVVDKKTLRVLAQTVSTKEFELTRDDISGESRHTILAPERANAPVLTNEEVSALADLGLRIEAHYGTPQDVEWASAGGKLYIVQTRPVTTLHAAASPHEEGEILVHGLGASPGSADGDVRVVETPQAGAELRKGEVLVARTTSPDWVPAMRRAAAIVTDSGGMTSHAAIVSRELGIPCIVGAHDATTQLHTGKHVTVDATAGVVMAGTTAPTHITATPRAEPEQARDSIAVTATRLYVNLAEPTRAREIAAMYVDGVGLLRAEFMMLEALENTHPRVLLRTGRSQEFVQRMAAGLTTIAAAFAPRPVIYRAMDFRTNEFRGLTGGAEFEPQEANPMIGYRGCYRYVREPDLFALELQAVRAVRERYDNLHLMLPFVRTAREFARCRELIDAAGLEVGTGLELWIMAEVPSVVYWLDEYVRLGATGVSIGSNDLTQLVLGVDRDSDVLAPLFDTRDGAVLDFMHRIVSSCRRLGITCSICGQAPSDDPELTRLLVEWGIDSVSVNADAIDVTRRQIAAAEQGLLLAEARKTLQSV
jgi:pyruvate,water dikinase